MTTGSTTSPPGPVAVIEGEVLAGARNIASGSYAADYDPNGNGPSWALVPLALSRLQSFTVTAMRAGLPLNSHGVQVKLGPTGSTIWLMEGQTISFSVAQDSGGVAEYLDKDINIDCLGDSAALILWTEGN